MIEANEDIALVTDRQIRDVEQGQAQAKAIAEGREVHPAVLEAASSTPAIDTASPPIEVTVTAQTIQQPPQPPPDPDTAMRHLRLSIVAVIVLILFFVWIRQKRR